MSSFLIFLAGCSPSGLEDIEAFRSQIAELRSLVDAHADEVSAQKDLSSIPDIEDRHQADWNAGADTAWAHMDGLMDCGMSSMMGMDQGHDELDGADQDVAGHVAAQRAEDDIADCWAEEEDYRAELDARLHAMDNYAAGWADQGGCDMGMM